MGRFSVWLVTIGLVAAAAAQTPRFTPAQQVLVERIGKLRSLDHAARAQQTRALALVVRALPADATKSLVALDLASLSTEGDFGRGTLQQVTTTLQDALAQTPPTDADMADAAYQELASLARYEDMKVTLSSQPYAAAVAKLEGDDAARAGANFTLIGLGGTRWTLAALRGKVVLVNFWATWCPPCRAEMPDLERLHTEFAPRGLVILGISDEKPVTVSTFVNGEHVTYPILLDPDDAVEKLYRVESIPMSFLYNRQGKLVAEAMDMRTRGQFLAMLAKAGL
ncbi:MAG: TlpA disulfide reductase family protein [Terriglobales bacterium]